MMQNLCYAPSTDACPTDKPSTIAPGDSANFFVEVRPGGFATDALVYLNLFEQSSNEALGTITAQFNLMTSATGKYWLRSICSFISESFFHADG